MTNKKIRYRKKTSQYQDDRGDSAKTTADSSKPSIYSQGRPYCAQTLNEKGPHRITDGDNLFEYNVLKFEAVDSSFLKFRL